MVEENQMLVLRDNAKAELMQIKSIEDGVTYLNKVKSIEVWVKAEKKDAELQNIIAEQKLRTQRILGGLLKDSVKHEGGRPNKNSTQEEPLLSDFGINKKQSSTFQAIADIPEETFEEFIEEKKAAVNNAVAELTTSGAVRLAKSLKEKKEDVQTLSDIEDKLNLERELRNLATELRKKYDRESIDLLVKFLTK